MDCREMVLSDTVEMMQSEDYKERFRAEYHQNRIRYEKLKYMVKRWDEGSLDFEPTCSRDIYDSQLAAMKQYIIVLRTRAEIEGVDL